MINLLGPERKKHIRAARRNSIWVRYIFLLASTSIALIIILGGASFYFFGQKITQDAKLQANKEKQITKEYSQKEKEVLAFKKNIQTAKAIFDAETYYSVVLLDIAKTMPEGSVIKGVDLNQSSFGSQQTVDFGTVDVDTAIKLKDAFANNPPLSTKVRFSQVEKPDISSGGTLEQYPVKVTMFMDLKNTGLSNKSTGGTQ